MLDSNNIDKDGALILAKKPNLKDLSINNNPLGNEGAIALAQNKSIEELKISNCNRGDKGAYTIATMQLTSIMALLIVANGC